MKFLAKSDGTELAEHVRQALEVFESFWEVYGHRFDPRLRTILEFVIKHHDDGKCASFMQHTLYQNSKLQMPAELAAASVCPQVPHGILSCFLMDLSPLKQAGCDKRDLSVAVSSVYAHHARAYPFPFRDIKDETLSDLARNASLAGISDKLHARNLSYNEIAKDLETAGIKEDWWKQFLIVKGLLNKFDYAASSGICEKEHVPPDAAACVQHFMQANGYAPRDCQRYLAQHAEENVILTASTGIGKTEGSLLWAGDCKTFYTLPVMVSLNAMYSRLRGQLYPAEEVALLHSDALSLLTEIESKEHPLDRLDKSRLYAYPLTLCTVDQLFLFVFRALGTEIQAATLSYSKVIVDEIQSYNPKVLAQVLYGLKVVKELGGKFLIMTATLPPFVREYFQGLGVTISPPFYLDRPRHRFRLAGEAFDLDEIVERSGERKVLVICNTVSRAQQVYLELKQRGADANLLHSRFIGNARRRKEQDIQSFARGKDTGVWVTTQLVEASLDIDFDLLYSEMATADSLLQRFGRCYRSRTLEGEEANIVLVDSGNGKGYVYDPELYDRSVRVLAKYEGLVMTEQMKQEYVDEVYRTDEIKHTRYYAQFLERLDTLEYLPVAGMTKKEAQKRFREIETVSAIPFAFREEAASLIDSLKNEETAERAKIFMKLRDFSVSVSPYSKRYDLGESMRCGFVVCNNAYSEELGLVENGKEDNFC